MPPPSSARPITGDEIISELIRNVEAGAFKVRYTVLVPCIFNVYLHAEDYDQIRPISEFVRTEAKAALADHLASLNKGGPSITRWLGIGGDRVNPRAPRTASSALGHQRRPGQSSGADGSSERTASMVSALAASRSGR